MKMHNILTGKDRVAFTRLRNRSFGSLHFCQSSLLNIIRTDAISQEDKLLLAEAIEKIYDVIKRWDKHYSSKLFKQLEEASK